MIFIIGQHYYLKLFILYEPNDFTAIKFKIIIANFPCKRYIVTQISLNKAPAVKNINFYKPLITQRQRRERVRES